MLSRLLVPVALSTALLFFGPTASPSPAGPLLAIADIAISPPPELAVSLPPGTSNASPPESFELDTPALEKELFAARMAALDANIPGGR